MAYSRVIVNLLGGNMEYKDFKNDGLIVEELFMNDRVEDAIDYLKICLKKYPEYHFEIHQDILWCYYTLGDYNKTLDMLREGIELSYFYGLHSSSWDKLRSLPAFSGIERDNNILKEKFQKECSLKYRVVTPKDYNEDMDYPLFVVLHGDGTLCNMDIMEKEWKSDCLEDFIVLYIQSSRAYCTRGYGWTDDYKKASEDILEALGNVTDSYNIDLERVILGGYSGGAMAVIDLYIRDLVKMKGIVALCPNEVEGTTEERIRAVAKNGTRVVILEGDREVPNKYQDKLIGLLKRTGTEHDYILNIGLGHSIPSDFKGLTQAVSFIMNE